MDGELAHHALSVSVALLAGYLFIHISYFRRYSAEHLRTDRFALHLFAFAVAFVMGGAFIAAKIPDWTHGRFHTIQTNIEFIGFSPTAINAIILAIVFGLLDNACILFRMRNDKAVQNIRKSWLLPRMRMAAVSLYVRRSNDAMLRTLFRATVMQKQILLTLKSEKVYVGIPMFQPDGDPTRPITSVKIFPIASGYRDRRTKRVTLSMKYSELLTQLKRTHTHDPPKQYDRSNPFLVNPVNLAVGPHERRLIDAEDMGILVSWNQVTSLTLFDEHVYNWFEKKERSSP